ncbi:MAG: fibronectin type III domain-containing protein, partial [Actinomycetota bacterium]|nr:fibronectin type III domain-containing protein [Actinomycetota bacterium]
QAMAVLTADGELDQRFGIGGVRTTTGNRVIGLATSPLTDLLVARVADAGHTEVAALELVEAPIITGVTGRPAAVSVEWHVPPGLAAETVLYEVLAVSDGAVTGYALVAGDVRSVSLTGLHGDDHAISVRPISRTGYGRSSDPVMAATDAGGPAATPPAQPTLAGVWEGSGPTQDRVRVAWTPAADNGAPIVAYSVAAFDAHTGEILSFRSLGADARSAIVPNLRFGRRAEVWVFAWNAQGMGDVTKVEVNPGNDLPLSTAGPWLPWAAAWRVSGSTYVTWGAAFEGHEPVAGYDVLLLVDGAFRGWYQTGPDARQLVLPLIPADEHAQVYVTAHGATSLGPLGDPITVTGGLG